MGNKDKGGKHSKKAPAKGLKEKRADKKAKKDMGEPDRVDQVTSAAQSESSSSAEHDEAETVDEQRVRDNEAAERQRLAEHDAYERRRKQEHDEAEQRRRDGRVGG